MYTKVALHLLIISEILKSNTAWKMQLCIKGSTITIMDKDCPYGLWLSQPWEISTACFDGGIWAVYKEWCQEKPFIWTVHPSTRGCMRQSILNKVIGIVYLGSEAAGAAISTKRHKLFLTSVFSQEAQNVSSNSNQPRLSIKESETDILIWGQALFSAHELSSSGDDIKKCFLKGRHTYSASYSLPLKFRHNIILKIGHESCLSEKSHRWEASTLLPQYLDSFEVISSEHYTYEFHCEAKNQTFSRIRSKTFKRNIKNINYVTYSRNKDLLTVIRTERINEQTERIARKLIAHVFIEEPLPAMEFAEWNFLLIAHEIFDKACPQELVPKEFFEHIIIFYRFLLVESFEKFPPNIDEDEETRFRIEENLHRCLSNSKPISFKDYSDCSTGSEPLVVEYTHSNGTTEDATVQIPAQVKLDTKFFDVILESTWKLMIFVHYYCADYFKKNPQDLSTLHHRWQELMNPDLLTRWQYPGESFIMFKSLIRTVDLARSLRHLDHCVAASHMYSAYSGWVKRPVPLQTNAQRSSSSGVNGGGGLKKMRKLEYNFYSSPIGSHFPEQEWDGIMHCMSSYNYPAMALGYPKNKCGIE